MQIIRGRNVNETWAQFMRLMLDPCFVEECTLEIAPRGRRTREIIGPTMTQYAVPEECVLLDPVRDCNPFFHLYEAMWMLAGRNEVDRLAHYNAQMASYSDNGATLFGAYGYRWRVHFHFDQLTRIVQLLREDPDTRRAVLAMWDGGDLLSAQCGKDLPCNLSACFLVRDGRVNLTVYNRSNDAVWGCYGANAVHFSFLLQYVAAATGYKIGSYTQVSNSLHVYLEGKPGEVWQRCAKQPPPLMYFDQMYVKPLVQDANNFLREAFLLTDDPTGAPGQYRFTEPWINEVALPMLIAHIGYKHDDLEGAFGVLEDELVRDKSQQDAWLLAGRAWIQRRLEKRQRKEAA